MKQPALLLASGVIIGVALASWLPAAVAVGMGLVLLGWRPLAALGVAIGALRILVSPLDPPVSDLVTVAGTERTILGVVDSFPEHRGEYQQFVVTGETMGRNGRTLVRTDPFSELSPGDRVSVTGQLTEPKADDEFDYRSYLAKDGIHSILRRADVRVEGSHLTVSRLFYAVRRTWVRQVERTFPEPTAGFMLGILIGERSTLSDAHIEAFRRTGTTHILALSGFNISIIITAIVWVLGRKPAALVISLLLIACFVLMVGPSASVARAALMGGFLLLGQLFGRPQAAMFATVLTAAGMLLLQPHALRYDLGFDLSFLATLGILWLEPGIRTRLPWVPDSVSGIVSGTLAAGITTAPLIALTFGTASLVAPLTNLFVVPAIPLLMLGGFVGTAISFVLPGVAAWPAVLVAAATELLLAGVERTAALPVASVSFGNLKGPIALLLAATVGLCAVRLRPRAHV
ncbi:MAG TPA: ComEC/Rec2 family competence protein [Patescibacteria group bacterium]|jgi:competence protein ComEC